MHDFAIAGREKKVLNEKCDYFFLNKYVHIVLNMAKRKSREIINGPSRFLKFVIAIK